MSPSQDLPEGETEIERVDLEKLNWEDIRMKRETFSDLTRKIERLQQHTTTMKESSKNTRGVLFVLGLLIYVAFLVTEHLTLSLPPWMTHLVRVVMFIFTLYFIASDQSIALPQSIRLVFAVVVASLLLLATSMTSSASERA